MTGASIQQQSTVRQITAIRLAGAAIFKCRKFNKQIFPVQSGRSSLAGNYLFPKQAQGKSMTW
jgi:hypothetical protein